MDNYVSNIRINMLKVCVGFCTGNTKGGLEFCGQKLELSSDRAKIEEGTKGPFGLFGVDYTDQWKQIDKELEVELSHSNNFRTLSLRHYFTLLPFTSTLGFSSCGQKWTPRSRCVSTHYQEVDAMTSKDGHDFLSYGQPNLRNCAQAADKQPNSPKCMTILQ